MSEIGRQLDLLRVGLAVVEEMLAGAPAAIADDLVPARGWFANLEDDAARLALLEVVRSHLGGVSLVSARRPTNDGE